jgi:Copper type II ascorbate-dependent monooxygenase, C-terminal domain
VFAGAFIFNIPSNNQPFTKTGGCMSSTSYTTFAVWPHQHKLGTHQKVTVTRGGNATVLHDDAYSFNEQNYYAQTPMFDIQQGDKIDVACTWVNNTGNTVMFGESSNDEMCFAGFYRFPAQNEGIAKCTDTNGIGF